MLHHNGNAKLNPQRVREMLRLRAEGYSYPQLARHFKVSTNTVQKICTGQSWQSVTQGQEVLTDGEAQLRLLSNGAPPASQMPSQEEQSAAIARLLKVQEETDSHKQESSVPEQYRGMDPTADPEAYGRIVQQMVEEGRRRTVNNGSPPPSVLVRYPTAATHNADDLSQHEVKDQAAINAEKLLETLKDDQETTPK